MARFVRYEIGNCVVRFFFNRVDAIERASLLTKGSNEQHREFETEYGFYLVKNDVTQDLFDNDGVLPDATAEVLDPERVAT